MNRPLALRRLEDRDCPALTIVYAGGNLTVLGTPSAGSGDELLIQRVAGNTFTVTDDTINYGSYAVTGNLALRLQRYDACDITVDLNGGLLPGNLTIDLGLGNTNALFSGVVSVFAGTSAAGTGVGGSIDFRNGSGEELLVVGSLDVVPSPIRVGNDVRATLRQANSFGDTLSILGATVVGRDVIATRTDAILIADFTTPTTAVGRNLIVNAGGAGIGQVVTVFGQVNGNVVMVGTNDSVFGDDLQIEVGAVVGGDVTVAAFDGLNFTEIFGTVSGSLTHVGGAGADYVEVSGGVDGSMQLVLGDGDNEFAFPAAAVISGALTVQGGNGADTLDGPTLGLTGFEGTVHGNVSLNLGNGDNTLTLVGAVNGSRLDYTGGSGVDSVTIDSAGTYALRVALGAGLDTFVYGVNAVVGSANLDFGSDFDLDVFTQLVAAITWDHTVLRLP